MPNNNNKKKNLPKGRRPRRNRKNNARYATSQMKGAPVGVSQDLQQFTKFYPSSNQSGIRIHTCVPISQVLRDTANANGTGLQPGTSGNAAISAQLNLTAPAWLTSAGTKFGDDYTSPIFDLIASAFVRYKVSKLVFHYEPQAAATTTERLVFAFAEDPLHPVLWNSTVPTQSSLLSLSDSIAFAPWRGWSMNCSQRLSDTLFYTYSNSSTTVSEFSERFSDFGIMSLVTDSVSGTNTACGVLYMEIIVELVEFCPITTISPAASKRLLPKLDVRSKVASYKPVKSESSSSNQTLTKQKCDRCNLVFQKHQTCCPVCESDFK